MSVILETARQRQYLNTKYDARRNNTSIYIDSVIMFETNFVQTYLTHQLKQKKKKTVRQDMSLSFVIDLHGLW